MLKFAFLKKWKMNGIAFIDRVEAVSNDEERESLKAIFFEEGFFGKFLQNFFCEFFVFT